MVNEFVKNPDDELLLLRSLRGLPLALSAEATLEEASEAIDAPIPLSRPELNEMNEGRLLIVGDEAVMPSSLDVGDVVSLVSIGRNTPVAGCFLLFLRGIYTFP